MKLIKYLQCKWTTLTVEQQIGTKLWSFVALFAIGVIFIPDILGWIIITGIIVAIVLGVLTITTKYFGAFR